MPTQIPHRLPRAFLATTLLLALARSASAENPDVGVSIPADEPAPRGQCSLTCPADIVANTEPGLCGATVTYAAPVSANCVISGPCSPASGTFFNTGTTTVNCQASDPGNPGMILATCSFKVTVKDAEPPTLLCPAANSITLKADKSGQAEIPDLMSQTGFSENCPAGASITSQDPPAGTKVNPGTTNVTVFGRDVAGNTATCIYALRVDKADCGGGMCGTGVAPAIVGAMLLVPFGRDRRAGRRRR